MTVRKVSASKIRKIIREELEHQLELPFDDYTTVTNPSTPASSLSRFVDNDEISEKLSLASNPNTSSHTLYLLANDDDPKVRETAFRTLTER